MVQFIHAAVRRVVTVSSSMSTTSYLQGCGVPQRTMVSSSGIIARYYNCGAFPNKYHPATPGRKDSFHSTVSSSSVRVVRGATHHHHRCSYSSINMVDHANRVQRVLEAKRKAGISYDELAIQLGVTNTYAAQLLLGQAKLTSTTATKLQQILPTLTVQDIQDMQTNFPMRTYDNEILKEPNIYRTYEAITHYGEAIKSIINEQCGDGIMSAIDFYCDVGTTTGKNNEKRVVITFNGKFLPFIEQNKDDNTVSSPRD